MTTTMRQEEFLRRFHAERPGVTGEALARGAGPDGRSSYAMLCDLVRDARAVLDLGCGDGLLLERLAARDGRGPGGGGDGTGAAPGGGAGRLLAGVDLSAEALAAARGRAGVPAGAALARARAQRLPFADGSFDACVSHMALMLMGEVDLVAAEVARVLRPGGVLACVVGGGAVPGGGDAYERFLPLLRDAVEAVPAGRRMPRLGDPRTRTREGLGEVLRGAGFGAVGLGDRAAAAGRDGRRGVGRRVRAVRPRGADRGGGGRAPRGVPGPDRAAHRPGRARAVRDARPCRPSGSSGRELTGPPRRDGGAHARDRRDGAPPGARYAAGGPVRRRHAERGAARAAPLCPSGACHTATGLPARQTSVTRGTPGR